MAEIISALEPWAWWAILAGALLLVAVLVTWLVRRRGRSRRLSEQFGSEYERTVERSGNRREAEQELEERVNLRQSVEVRPLAAPVRRRYLESWQSVQGQFVDNPVEAVREAGRLVDRLMAERGYDFDDFEERAAAFSVDYPHLTERYREAHAMSLDPEEHPPRTEELRQVLLDYRLMLEELLDTPAFGEDAAEPLEETPINS